MGLRFLFQNKVVTLYLKFKHVDKPFFSYFTADGVIDVRTLHVRVRVLPLLTSACVRQLSSLIWEFWQNKNSYRFIAVSCQKWSIVLQLTSHFDSFALPSFILILTHHWSSWVSAKAKCVFIQRMVAWSLASQFRDLDHKTVAMNKNCEFGRSNNQTENFNRV